MKSSWKSEFAHSKIARLINDFRALAEPEREHAREDVCFRVKNPNGCVCSLICSCLLLFTVLLFHDFGSTNLSIGMFCNIRNVFFLLFGDTHRKTDHTSEMGLSLLLPIQLIRYLCCLFVFVLLRLCV